ncbi:MAG: type secretion system protein [Symbiobacteriaceae bacterium]|jgi:pilus assembly protein CpaF|nr:type secretion system protein [Symbiobacteriaceae bacterium]
MSEQMGLPQAFDDVAAASAVSAALPASTEFDRILQEKTVMAELVQAIAGALRPAHGVGWLVAFYSPAPRDQAEMGFAVRTCLQQLARDGRAPEWHAIQPAATQWLSRFIQSRSEQVTKLRDLVDRTAAKVAAAGAAGQAWEIFLSPERRIAVSAEIARDLGLYLGPEQMAATEPEILALAEWLVKENLGAGALEDYLRDPGLTEIMVGSGGQIWVEKDGRVEDAGQTLPETRALWFAQRLAAIIGSRIDQSEPSMDGFLSDGSRVHVILPPIAIDGVSITIRRHSRRPTLEQLVENGAVSEDAVAFLRDAVGGMANVLVSGGTSSGKTTILNVVAGFIGDSERVLTMEDAPELRLPLPHVIRLRTRKANIESRGEFTMRMLVKEALRMRPDRIVVGEVRGAEALDMIEAMNTGHDGCLSTAHANGPLDMLKRLGQMMKRGDPQLTDAGAYELVASALHLIVHAERRVAADGRVTRGVEEIAEVVQYLPERAGTMGFVVRPVFRRGADRVLRRVGAISEKLAVHLRLNGVDASRWVTDDGQ